MATAPHSVHRPRRGSPSMMTACHSHPGCVHVGACSVEGGVSDLLRMVGVLVLGRGCVGAGGAVLPRAGGAVRGAAAGLVGLAHLAGLVAAGLADLDGAAGCARSDHREAAD